MQHDQFKIGVEFMLSDRKYRVTDVGSRVVVALRLGEKVVERDGKRVILSEETADAEGWFNGPPYAVIEYVIDEDDLPACHLIPRVI